VIIHHAGDSPLIVSLPHVGTGIPADVAVAMTEAAHAVVDTDWHVDRLYGFARELGASWVQPTLSRYVVDLNRPPDDAALYPGQVSTGLCPAATFDGEPLYRGAPPDAAEIARRRDTYWSPYHARLQALLEAAVARHGHAVLLDAHSIRSQVPRLFEGRLPDINVGTNDGRSAAPALADAVMAAAGGGAFTSVLNGRFKGGHITRHYGHRDGPVHAVQIELAQSAYLDESRPVWDSARAGALMKVLRDVVDVLLAFRPH
jgi:N-formylglutamate deformylase